ncbi:MAG: GMC family oxidoreductase [Nitrosomonas sp.]|nr:GMC family oxidoreductase [Nitrosomonas sp.]MBP6076399.1 GMC family oxidoreductase [Nitrosomonas sp.]
MIKSASSIEHDVVIETDICVVGAGAAGIPMALEFELTSTQVLLLESGDFKEDQKTQELYSGSVSDEAMHSPTDKYRQRRFGGSTTIWGGRCMPFDPIDFEKRDYIPHSGWPITANDLAEFYPKANNYLEAGYCHYDARIAFRPAAKPMFEGFTSSAFSMEGLERFSCPTDLGKRYQHRLIQSNNINLLLNANVTTIALNNLGTDVDFLQIATLSGNTFKVKAKCYVLAMGGIETTRLMLTSNNIHKHGIANHHDILGRFYMCHIAGNVGKLKINGATSKVQHGYEISPEGIYCRRRIQLAADKQKELGISNMVFRLHFPKITDPSHKSGILSGLFLAKSFVSYEYGKRLKDSEETTLKLYIQHVMNVLTDPLNTIKFLIHWLTKRTFAERKFPSVILPNKTNQFSLEVHAEQLPNKNSRIHLTNEKDALGMPKIHIDWQYLAEDVEAVKKNLTLFSEEIAKNNIGDFEFDADNLETELMRFGAYGGHHVGTTRMGNDPETSIVNKDCRVHGVSNLYIASSSIFPTSSQANPTLTITAMALRLATHIKTIL